MSTPRADTWPRVTAVVLARAYRSWLLVLTALAVAPLLLGWGSYVIRSGSMEPSISVGDVVVAKPAGPDDRVRVGGVAVFDDPAPGADHLLVHRIVELRDDGAFTSAGDANDVTDITPVPRDSIRATPAFLTPYVGLPVVWAQSGQWARLLAWLLLTAGALHLAGRRLDGEPPRGRWSRAVRRRVRPRRPAAAGRSHRVPAAPVAALAGLLVLGTAASTASADFTARTANAGSSWTVGRVAPAYADTVLADSPFLFWQLDETSGNQGADSSGHRRPALMTSVATGQPGALPHNPGTAVGLGGFTDRIVSGGAATAAPASFTTEMWVRKNSGGIGGKLIGFEDSQEMTSTLGDRTVYIRTNGRVVYGARASYFADSIESPTSLADNTWHHLVVTATGTAAKMYVDGVLVSHGKAVAPTRYAGWWRVGYGVMPPVKYGYPLASLTAQVDNVAVYAGELSAERVAAHYAAR